MGHRKYREFFGLDLFGTETDRFGSSLIKHMFSFGTLVDNKLRVDRLNIKIVAWRFETCIRSEEQLAVMNY